MAESSASALTLGRRLWLLLAAERRDLTYLYVYATLAGFINLSLPLGVQAVIGFVSSGAVSTSLVVLIGFIVLGTLLAGGLQVMQVYVVEVVQQRLFARVALDFAVRLPRVRTEVLGGRYLPELMNRMLDTPMLQKGFSTLLMEYSAAAVQIVFGLVLLTLYHPVFIVFGLLLLGLLALLIGLTGPSGLRTSITESKYKYRVVAWLEDVARTVHTFRHPPRQELVARRADELVEGYLRARQSHFRVLRLQFWGFVAFRTLSTAGLLVIGCWLLVARQINLGQFVAAEIVIILTITAIEKVLLKLDVVYDALTALDKIGNVLDLPAVPAHAGADLPLPLAAAGRGLRVELRHLSYKYPESATPALHDVSLTLQAGEHLGLAGNDGSGKTTLLWVLAGLLDGHTGVVAYDGLALQDLATEALGRYLGDNVSHQHVFDGTVLENLTLGQAHLTAADVTSALELVGLRDDIYARPLGLNTRLGSGMPLANSTRQKLLLARALVHRPRLLLLDQFLPGLALAEQQRVLRLLLTPTHPWTVVLASTDERMLAEFPRVALLRAGQLLADGSYASLSQQPELWKLIN